MRIREIAIVLRKGGFFYWNGQKIKAVYPKEGYAVLVFLEPSPIDEDFATYIWVPSAEELQQIKRKLDKSDDLTHNLLGHGWGGKRPFWKLYEFM